MNTSNPNQKPGLVTAIAVMTLASGIINLFWGFVASATALGTIIGVICLPLTILPTILGIFEIIYAAKILGAQPETVKPSPPLAVFEILTFLMGNVFSMVVGILNLIFYNDASVKEYFAQINSVAVLPPVPQATTPAEQLEELPVPVEPENPEPLEDAVKPKRVRKISRN
ncbi:MAG: hypothetical protein C4586_01510 [Anaerolineaceae bacterium]|nr:MAG: hypothetical protein C4586_01510 [Anaerolineaceae bacterium]